MAAAPDAGPGRTGVRLVAALVALVAPLGCTTDDTGQACAAATASPVAGIADESAIAAVVRVARDASCKSFVCLGADGLDPYCTRDCAVSRPPRPAQACTDDRGCTPPLACHDGTCADDDCPPGFVCRAPQATASQADRRLCMRRRDCSRDLDCDDVATKRCTPMACLDACLQQAGTCDAHVLTCAPAASLGCACNDGQPSCPDAGITCQPPGQAALPAGAVRQVSVCLPR